MTLTTESNEGYYYEVRSFQCRYCDEVRLTVEKIELHLYLGHGLKEFAT